MTETEQLQFAVVKRVNQFGAIPINTDGRRAYRYTLVAVRNKEKDARTLATQYNRDIGKQTNVIYLMKYMINGKIKLEG